MKRILSFLLIAMIFAGCNSKDASSTATPTATLDNMFTAMKSGKIDDLKKFITKQDAVMIEEGLKFVSSIDSSFVRKAKESMEQEIKEKSKDITYTLKNEKIDGDKASVDAEVTDKGKTETHTFNLVKEDGGWKIALSKSGGNMFNSMKGNMGPDEPDLKEGIEKLQQMDKDTLKMIMEKASKFFDTLKARKEHP